MGAPSYNVLEPLSFERSSIPVDGGFASILAQVGFLFSVVIFIFVLGRILISGFQFSLGAPLSERNAKENFKIAIYGLLVGALIVSVITFLNPNFGTLTFRYGTKNAADSVRGLPSNNENDSESSGNEESGGLVIPKDNASTTPTNPSSNDFAAITQDENRVRKILGDAEITFNKAPCKEEGQNECTSVGGTSGGTLTMLINLKLACDCAIQVTGGTEWWLHSKTTKHKPGGGAVDIARTAQLNTFIKSNFTSVKNKFSICEASYSWNGFYFCDEDSAHFHAEPL